MKWGVTVAFIVNIFAPIQGWLNTPHTFVIEASNPQVPEPVFVEAKNRNERVSKTYENDIEAYIYEVFGEDGDMAYAIAMCESRLNPKAFNDNTTWGGVGRDKGIFQINDYYHPQVSEECVYDYKCNIDYAKELRDSWGNWNAWSCFKFDMHLQFLR